MGPLSPGIASVDPATLVAEAAAGSLGDRCVDDACRARATPLRGGPWALGAAAPGLVRLDARLPGGLFSVFLRLEGSRITGIANSEQDPATELAVTTFPVDAWATAIRCAPGAGSCASLLAQAGSKGATLRPLATWSAGTRRLALVDFVIGGRAADRVWVYGEGAGGDVVAVGVDESEGHALAFLAGELPADPSAPLAADDALRERAAEWCAGREVPASLADRLGGGCTVGSAGRLGERRVVCLELASGDHLRVRIVGASAPEPAGYGSDCALAARSLYP